MSPKTQVFEVCCPDLDKDYWCKVTAVNRYDAVETFCSTYDDDQGGDGPYFPTLDNGAKFMVKGADGVVFNMEVTAAHAINYNVYDVSE